jgi:hypothetical protein
MTDREAIDVLFNEWKCIDRNDGIHCDRKCESCDLVMDVGIIREAFNMAISALQAQEVKTQLSREDTTSDLISRQAAIDAFMTATSDGDKAEWCRWVLKQLPSAQPEQSSEIQGILDYLDTVLHPIVSPEHWDVYSELHDMISRLLSAQFEPNCKGCKHQPRFSHEEPCCTCANNYENKYER